MPWMKQTPFLTIVNNFPLCYGKQNQKARKWNNKRWAIIHDAFAVWASHQPFFPSPNLNFILIKPWVLIQRGPRVSRPGLWGCTGWLVRDNLHKQSLVRPIQETSCGGYIQILEVLSIPFSGTKTSQTHPLCSWEKVVAYSVCISRKIPDILNAIRLHIIYGTMNKFPLWSRKFT